jgi:hypothetical protein
MREALVLAIGCFLILVTAAAMRLRQQNMGKLEPNPFTIAFCSGFGHLPCMKKLRGRVTNPSAPHFHNRTRLASRRIKIGCIAQ